MVSHHVTVAPERVVFITTEIFVRKKSFIHGAGARQFEKPETTEWGEVGSKFVYRHSDRKRKYKSDFQHLPTADNSPVVILSRLGTSGGRAAGESNPHRPPVIGKDNRTDYTNGSSKLWSGESRATSTGKWTVRLSHQLLWLVWLRPAVHTPRVQLCCSAKHSGSLTAGTPKIVFHGLLHVFAFLNPAVTVLHRLGRLVPDSTVLKRKRK